MEVLIIIGTFFVFVWTIQQYLKEQRIKRIFPMKSRISPIHISTYYSPKVFRYFIRINRRI